MVERTRMGTIYVASFLVCLHTQISQLVQILSNLEGTLNDIMLPDDIMDACTLLLVDGETCPLFLQW